VPTTELQKADRLLTGILSDILLFSKAGPTDEIAQFEALYSEALGRVLKSQVAEFAKIDITAEIADVMQYAGSVFGEKMAAKLEPEMNRYLSKAFRVGQAIRYVPENIQTSFDLKHQLLITFKTPALITRLSCYDYNNPGTPVAINIFFSLFANLDRHLT